MITDDTITAIATPVGSGGVGIIRISGDKAVQIASRVFNSTRGLSLNESVNNKVVSILEGGYDLNALKESSEYHLKALIEN